MLNTARRPCACAAQISASGGAWIAATVVITDQSAEAAQPVAKSAPTFPAPPKR